MSAVDSSQRMIAVGRLHGAFGVRGELKLESFTEPARAIASYLPWTLRDARGNETLCASAKVREGGKGLIATLPAIADRDTAEAMRGVDIWVPRSALPPPPPGEFYWVDLEGLRVVNLDGADFGTVSHIFNNGANDVLVVEGERQRMIPFVLPDYVRRVDFDACLVTVDWDADF